VYQTKRLLFFSKALLFTLMMFYCPDAGQVECVCKISAHNLTFTWKIDQHFFTGGGGMPGSGKTQIAKETLPNFEESRRRYES